MKEKYLITTDQKGKSGYDTAEREKIRKIFKRILRFQNKNYLQLIRDILEAQKNGNVNTEIVENYLSKAPKPPNQLMITRNPAVTPMLSFGPKSKLKLESNAQSFFLNNKNEVFSTIAFFGENEIFKYLTTGEFSLNNTIANPTIEEVTLVKGYQKKSNIASNDIVFLNYPSYSCNFGCKKENRADYTRMVLPIALTSDILIYSFKTEFKIFHHLKPIAKQSELKAAGNEKFGHLHLIINVNFGNKTEAVK
eukprot:Pgem_evm1s7562